MITVVCVFLLVTVAAPVGSNPVRLSSADDYLKARLDLIASEKCLGVGGQMTLNGPERAVDAFLLKEKKQVMDESRLNRTDYIPAVSFFLSKPRLETSPIFQIIKKMPKGAALHLHDLAITSIDWIVSNATYRDNVYMCIDENGLVQLKVLQTPEPNPGCAWKLVKTERENSGNSSEFDASLKQNISMLTSDPLVSYPGVTKAWDRFNNYFTQVIGILYYAPIMRDYYRKALDDFRKDNVQYIELRSQLQGYYELNGTVHDAEYGLNLYKEVTEDFVRTYPEFSGAKIIMSGLRVKNTTDIAEEVKTAMYLYKKYPNFFLGYDLVGQEDPNNPLTFYLDALLYPSQQNPPVKLPFYFHAAETNYQGTDTDYNLVDALLLNTTRIGHGFGLIKHPKLMEIVKAKGIAVEINPISNQVLGLVSDLRNHAAAPLLAQNIPVVISSDDPGTWEALPLSHDLYLAFMTLVGEDAGLDVLKNLVLNSLQYNSMNSTEKAAAKNLWQTKWDKFINETIMDFKLPPPSDFAIVKKCPDGPTVAPSTVPVTRATTRGNGAPTDRKSQLVVLAVPLCVWHIYTYVLL